MDQLIRALQIFSKYRNIKHPTHCEHDELWVVGFSQEEISAEDTAALDELGFFWDESVESWKSYRYGGG